MIWITLPKPKFAATKVPIGLSQKEIEKIKNTIIIKQSNVVKDAIDRVSFSPTIIELLVSISFDITLLI